MKEKYSMPVLIIQSFKVNDDIMQESSSWQCWTWFCRPNGYPTCFQNCYAGVGNDADCGLVLEAK